MKNLTRKIMPWIAGGIIVFSGASAFGQGDTQIKEHKELIERVGHGKVFVEGVQNNFGTNKVVVSVEFDAPTGRCCVGGDLKDPADLRELLIALVRKLDITPCEEEEMLERFDQNLLKDRATAVIDKEGQLVPVQLR